MRLSATFIVSVIAGFYCKASLINSNQTGVTPLISNATSLPVLQPIESVDTASLLNVGYYDAGPRHGQVVILLHGFPYDINSFADVAPRLLAKGYRVVAPYLRGYGPTRFLNLTTPRSADQAALGYDLVTLMDALHIERAILAGFDWGTIPVNVVAAIWPERVSGVVAVGSYLIQDRSTAWTPAEPESESARWYFYLFLTPRGYAGLAQQLRAYARSIWQKNSPQWKFTDAEFERSLPALYNQDFIEISVHFYKNRLLYAPGDPAYDDLLKRLDEQPPIPVPAVTLDPQNSTTFPATDGTWSARFFTGPRIHHVIADTGENIPQQNPIAFVDAILEVHSLVEG